MANDTVIGTSTEDEGSEDPLATNDPAKEIVAIDRGVVHQICSGQVVLTLATAVKELLENSLDAGATVVDIKLREMGSEMIEVSDNGHGVEERNFRGMTVKHATSKLREFTDLFSVETFGFRGEALSSLCALSSMTISTRHKSSPTGTMMTYDHHGNILSSTTQARPVGTTVSLANLFSTMPVRQKEFHRSLKREFGKMISVMSAYGLVSSGVKIMVTNCKAKGGRTVVLHTQGSEILRDNMVNIFGTKQMSSLRPFKQVSLTDEDLTKANIRFPGTVPSVRLEGFISSPVHGEGRGAPDRQFYFVNNRPCDPTKLIKLVNQVYHGFNRHQFPFVCLNILTERNTVDINITPDKRQVFLTNERFLNELVKKSLEKMFEDAPCTMDTNTFLSKPNSMSSNSVENGDLLMNKENVSNQSDVPKFNIANLKRNFSSSFSNPSPSQGSSKKQKTMQSFLKVGPAGDNDEAEEEIVEMKKQLSSPVPQASDEALPSKKLSSPVPQARDEALPSQSVKEDLRIVGTLNLEGKLKSEANVLEDEVKQTTSGLTITFDTYSPQKSQASSESHPKVLLESFTSVTKKVEPSEKENKSGLNIIFDDFSSCSSRKDSPPIKLPSENSIIETCIENDSFRISFETSGDNDKPEDLTPVKTLSRKVKVVVEDVENQVKEEKQIKKGVKAVFCFDKLRNSLNAEEKCDSTMIGGLKFKAQIKASENSNAEAELQKQIKKTDFANMKVFGQFNLGFLITGLNSDLFIVDQHATDEKYNFETLQKTTVIKSQKMVVPQKLELTSVNESVLIDNLPVFEKNGFHFEIDEKASTTEKVSLASLPISKNWTFGKEDIDELIFMLSEAGDESTEHFRPSRVRAMFASRACRSSVMVGTSLSKQDMIKLIRHMGEIEQPWNCPHGRPTIRHLVNTDMVR